VAEAPAVRIRVPEVDLEARISSFTMRLVALGGEVVRVATGDEARAVVAEAIAGKNAVASNAPYLADLGITKLDGVQTGITDVDELRGLCATTDFGITSADYAVCDTGTLVMIASPREARLVSLLPPAHIAIVPLERMLTGLDELFSLLPRPAEQTSSMVLITGPSRTADIEQILVRGVHGPGRLKVVLVG
jgi:L-lactate dehydrogenase complex protein LldG